MLSKTDIGVYICFRTTSKTFDLTQVDEKLKTFQILFRELLYANYVDFIAHPEENMPFIMDLFSRVYTAFRLTISLKKTKIIFTPPPGQLYVEPNIFIQSTRLDILDFFLGSTLSRDDSLDSEINQRIKKASKSFGKLENRMLSDRGITIKIKVCVYELSILLPFCYLLRPELCIIVTSKTCKDSIKLVLGKS